MTPGLAKIDPQTESPSLPRLRRTAAGTRLTLLSILLMLAASMGNTAFGQGNFGAGGMPGAGAPSMPGSPGSPGTMPQLSPNYDARQRLATGGVMTPLDDTGEVVAGVRFEGVRTIVADELYARIKTERGRPLSPRQIREDVRNLYKTRWFYSVERRVEDTPDGPVVVFTVLERPIVQKVEYHGNKKLKDSYLAALTGLQVGSPYDVALNKESAKRIEREYHDKGYLWAKVELVKGASRDDRDIIFKITEGKKVVVRGVSFEGNKEISGGVLKTKIRTKTQLLWIFGGKYDPSSPNDDESALKAYYQGLGFFDIQIKRKIAYSDGRSKVYIKYIIDEGPRYRIRSIDVQGADVIPEKTIRDVLTTRSGDTFFEKNLTTDIDEIRTMYGKLGRFNANVTAVPVFLETPGVMDLKLMIDEDEIWRIRKINVHITGAGGQPSPHTKESVVRNGLTVFPGDLADPSEIERSKLRVNRHNLFEQGEKVRFEFNPVPETERRFALNTLLGDETVRAQNTETTAFDTLDDVRGQNFDENGQEIFRNPAWENNPDGNPFGPQGDGAPPVQQQYREGDLDIYLEEARTGRLMFGVGLNSNQGLVGNIVLDERNFDIFRPPTSVDDILEGRAWRGGGQTFRLEAIPGSIVSRYSISWIDPYLFNSDYSLSTSGSYYQQFFQSWNEARTGTRIGVGRQITPPFTVNATVRLENVQISHPRGLPPPPDLLAVVGSNTLSTAQVSAAHDTRDSAFLPSQGHNLVASFEQAFGQFNYPKAQLNASQYFTVHQRLDGGGRHILSFNANTAWTGNNTPIFERFYAGGFSSFRGFYYRSVSPTVNRVRIGGNFQLLGSVQYQFPVMADETIQLVTFSDFGTVDRNVSLNNFSVTVGGGIRIKIPAMAAVPLAFDWGVPVLNPNHYRAKMFNFYFAFVR